MTTLLIVITTLLCCLLIPIAGITGYTCYLLIRRPLKAFYRQRASEDDFCRYEQIPKKLIEFILFTEDVTFFRHHGLIFKSIRLAFRYNKRARRIVMGGSTITQQLMKNLYFRFEHSYLRKMVEALLALHAEFALGKEKILELYLNVIYFGNGQYGVVDAAHFYFNKPISELTENQMFMLACLPQAPTAANPLKRPEVYVRLREKKLAGLTRLKVIAESDAEKLRMYDASALDPELRACGPTERLFPDTIVMVNERFGLTQLKHRLQK